MHDFIRGTAIKTPVPLALLAGAGRDGLWLTTAAGRVHEEAGACRMAAVHQQDEARAAREDPLRPERRRHGFLCAHLVCNNIATYPEFGEVGLLFEKCFFFVTTWLVRSEPQSYAHPAAFGRNWNIDVRQKLSDVLLAEWEEETPVSCHINARGF